MGVDYITISQLPPEFMDELMREFRPYTVALSRIRNNDAKTFRALGAGVFVTKGKRFGILTAHHCLHACEPEVVVGSQAEGVKLCTLHSSQIRNAIRAAGLAPARRRASGLSRALRSSCALLRAVS